MFICNGNFFPIRFLLFMKNIYFSNVDGPTYSAHFRKGKRHSDRCEKKMLLNPKVTRISLHVCSTLL